MARQPLPRRLSTLSSMPCDTWNRDTSGSGGEVMRRVNVFLSQWTKLRSGGLRVTDFLPPRAVFSLSRRFSITCSGACATT